MEERKILELLCKNYGLRGVDIELLRESGGKVYGVNCKGQKYLLKISGSAFSETIRRSVDIMLYLAENGFPVPRIIKTNSDEPMLRICNNDCDQLFILYEYIEGSEPELSQCAENIGELTARLHELLNKYDAIITERSKQFFIDRYVEILRKKEYPGIKEYELLGTSLWDRVKCCSVGVCHGDLHRGNLIKTSEGKIYMMDFDTVCIAPRMFDVMVMCDMTDYFHLTEEGIQITEKTFKSFLEGYQRHIKLLDDEIESFNVWVAIRHFQLQATIVEIYGMDCINDGFIDDQLKWLNSWCSTMGIVN